MATLAPRTRIAATRGGSVTADATATTSATAARYVFAGLRLALGWVFLWAFLDKLFGLGHETPPRTPGSTAAAPPRASSATPPPDPFKGFYNGIAGAAWADWLFMVGLLGIGVALILGIGMRIAAVAGALLLVHDVDRRPAPGEQPVHGRPPHLRRHPDRPRPHRRRQHPRPRHLVEQDRAGPQGSLAAMTARAPRGGGTIRRLVACRTRGPAVEGASP